MGDPIADEDNLDDWDFEQAVVVEPSAAPGAMVAVRFSLAEFEQLSRAAEQEGVRTTEYVRAAALALSNQVRLAPDPLSARQVG